MSKINGAFERLRSGKARYRIVLAPALASLAQFGYELRQLGQKGLSRRSPLSIEAGDPKLHAARERY